MLDGAILLGLVIAAMLYAELAGSLTSGRALSLTIGGLIGVALVVGLALWRFRRAVARTHAFWCYRRAGRSDSASTTTG